MQPPVPISPPLLLRWQGLLAEREGGALSRHLPQLAGWVLCALMLGLPWVTRGGLSLLIAAAGLLWLLWALRTPAGRIGPINGWLSLAELSPAGASLVGGFFAALAACSM